MLVTDSRDAVRYESYFSPKSQILFMPCLIGVDIGTTNVKALAYDPSTDQIIGSASLPITTYYPKPNQCEQSPAEIWDAFVAVMNDVSRQMADKNMPIQVIAFSTAMHSIIAVDQQHNPLTNAVIWSDNRAEAEATILRTDQAALGQAIYQHTGIPIHPMIPLCKLAYWRHHEPELFHQAAKFISVKEYIWFRLTGAYEIDYSIANATGLFDAERHQWSDMALSFAGVHPDQLSELVPTTHQHQITTPSLAHELGLPTDVVLLIGASDGCLANLGAGAIAAGTTTLTIGTSGAIRQTVQHPLRDSQGRLFCYHLDEGYYVVGGPTNNGANVLQWLSEHFTKLQTADVLNEALQIKAGADGLLFFPYLHGERAPLWDASVRGAYLNVDWNHTQAHFTRAALEGVLFNLWSINQLLFPHTGQTQVIHANGGFAQSAFWVQMLADIAGVPVKLNASNESGAIGAILLAMKATGMVTSLEEAANLVSFGQTFEPDVQCHAIYQQAFQRWSRLLTVASHADILTSTTYI